MTVAAESDGTFVAEGLFHPLPEHRGRRGWLHGGLAATVLDHACARAAAAALGAPAVTGRLDVRYREPVLLAGGPYQVRAVAAAARSQTVTVKGSIIGPGHGRTLVEANTLFVVY